MKASVLAPLGVLSCLTTAVLGDWQFRSRPGLSPPKLNITVPAQEGLVEKGLIFVTPYPGFGPNSKGPEQPAAYIFRDNGDLVWSGLSFFSGFAANFKVQTWNGQKVLSAFQGQWAETPGRAYGHHVLLNNRYEVVKTVRANSHRFASLHEFLIVDETTALIEITSALPISLTPWGGTKEQNWILSTGFQEIDIDSGKVLFEWESIDHVDPKDSNIPLAPSIGHSSSQAWDYFHLNSVDKDGEGNYIISARNSAAIYKINGTSGEIIWTLGGHSSSFEIDSKDTFAYQHDARLLHRSEDGSIERLSLFDNAASEVGEINPVSRVRVIEVDHNKNTSKALRTYPAPDGSLARSQGNAQVLPNGNVFTNWGQAGAVTEFSHDGEVLFHAYLDSAPSNLVQSYRGSRFNWTGIPSEDPVIAIVGDDARGSADIYVSWNGDTETTTWCFYVEFEGHGATGLDKAKLVGEVERIGFESHLNLKISSLEYGASVFAEAIDASGKVLRRSPSAAFLKRPRETFSSAGPSVNGNGASEDLARDDL
ncbi:Secreted protein [Fusarium heterosporum]|uniref:Secreted protein n=1 Tax=Fusarium heterosporum TaxID=42747 RepID=A0A8H5SU89_FUSHE|nr:Secreted protein [Fusarium heterosporum]